jgi:protein TonB
LALTLHVALVVFARRFGGETSGEHRPRWQAANTFDIQLEAFAGPSKARPPLAVPPAASQSPVAASPAVAPLAVAMRAKPRPSTPRESGRGDEPSTLVARASSETQAVPRPESNASARRRLAEPRPEARRNASRSPLRASEGKAVGRDGARVEEPLIAVFQPRPEYPRRALLAGMEGTVTLEFTVTREGRVLDPQVVTAEPPDVFDAAAQRALLRWTFEPKRVNGTAVSRRARLDVNFKLDR